MIEGQPPMAIERLTFEDVDALRLWLEQIIIACWRQDRLAGDVGRGEANVLVADAELADAAQLASFPDETPEGRSIVVLVKDRYGMRARELTPLHARFVPFTAQTRMSGVDVDGRSVRKGAASAVLAHVAAQGGSTPTAVSATIDAIAAGDAAGRAGQLFDIHAGIGQVGWHSASGHSRGVETGKARGRV